MKDVQLDVLKKLMDSMSEKSAGRLPGGKTGTAVLEITMRDGGKPEEEIEMPDDGQDGEDEFENDSELDPRLAAIMKKKKAA